MTESLRRLRRTLTVLACLAAATPSLAQDAAATRKDVASTANVAAEVGYVAFSGSTDPWRLASVSVWRRGKRGTFIARVNYANRFATDGVQVEADAYPRLTDKVYLYLNVGNSSGSVFPSWRIGGETFTTLPGAWEASVGFRQLRFGGAPVTLLTGALGKYVGNYWLSLRPYLRSKNGDLSSSAAVTGRRYFADGDHWVGATMSYGSSPTERLTPDAIGRTHAFSMVVNGSTGLTPHLLATWTIGRDAEELGPRNTRTSLALTAGVRLAF